MAEVADRGLVSQLDGDGTEDGRSHLFRADVSELVVVSLSEERTRLLTDSWHEGRGVRRQER